MDWERDPIAVWMDVFTHICSIIMIVLAVIALVVNLYLLIVSTP